MALQDGDVIRLDYTLFVGGKPIDTSQEEVAKARGIHRDGRRYQPLVAVLGRQQIIAGLESHIRSHGQAGKAVRVEIAAGDAYGERRADRVRDVPMAQFKAQKVTPEPGMGVTLGGERGVVTRVAGGRVRVDLNHDLAGQDLTYEYVVREVITDDAAKVGAVLDGLFRPGTYKAEVQPDAVVVQVPEAVRFDPNWMMAKFRVVASLRAATGSRKAIRLVEAFPAAEEEPGHEGHGHPAGEHPHG